MGLVIVILDYVIAIAIVILAIVIVIVIVIIEYNMSVKVDFKEIVAYDFSNLNLQENSTNNCFGAGLNSYGDCDMCDSCDHGW